MVGWVSWADLIRCRPGGVEKVPIMFVLCCAILMCAKLCCAVSLNYFAYLAAAAVDWFGLTCAALYCTELSVLSCALLQQCILGILLFW